MNKRRKSLYNEGAENGFVFRTLPKLPPGNSSTIQQKESADGGFTFRRVTEPTTTDVNSSFDTGLDEAEKADEAFRRRLEVKSLIAHLKKDLIATEAVSESEFLEQIETDLNNSDVYFGYLESHDDEVASQNPLVHQLQESIEILKANSEMYKRELKEWDDVLKRKQTEVNEWKRDIESERDVDFRHLTLDDVEILRTYLTPDQKKVLEDVEKTPGFDQTFLEQSNARFARITVTIEKELEAIHNRCYAVLGKTHTALSGGSHQEWNKPEETPRTVFKSLKEL
ncbi:hypothetical protein EMCRGX_G020212 [Ephydatia muelleri]